MTLKITISTPPANRQELSEALGGNPAAVRRFEAMTRDITINLPGEIEEVNGTAEGGLALAQLVQKLLSALDTEVHSASSIASMIAAVAARLAADDGGALAPVPVQVTIEESASPVAVSLSAPAAEDVSDVLGALLGFIQRAFADPPALGSDLPAPVAATTLSAAGNEALTYGSAGGQSIPNNTATTLTGWTQITDRLNANFNASSGVYTALATGYYLVSAQIIFNTVPPAVIGDQFDLYVLVNGTVEVVASKFAESTTSNYQPVSMAARLFQLNAGDQLELQAFQNSGVGCTLMATSAENWLTIAQIP
ncbi:hypothetical protein [Burkholderia mayonis]|uniref:C1q domain-containing protein n=1 Tax=Burkholderia mayonis TaxID=1385591 RepID=A0A1B4G325_9BURK|nr:hypothetical protein [Burkholderia mayonis]AOJ10339.1 hypothetical protein WS71_24325 [Burkholderia mayonis]KVE53679.1 hypothetical protein WS71_06445 [Burkholderia mayonis]